MGKSAEKSPQDEVAPSTPGTANVAELNDSIRQQATKVRDLKAAKENKDKTENAIDGHHSKIGSFMNHNDGEVDDGRYLFKEAGNSRINMKRLYSTPGRGSSPKQPQSMDPAMIPLFEQIGMGDQSQVDDDRVGPPPPPPNRVAPPAPPPVKSAVSAPPPPSIPHSQPQGSPPPPNRGKVTVDLPDPQTSSDCQDSIVTVARGCDINREILNASSQESENLDSDIYGSITITKPEVQGLADSDIYGSITTTKPDVQGFADSDMCGSIIKKTVRQESSYSSDKEDVQNDTFAIMLRCKRQRGGYSRSVQNARSRDEALTWRYMFKNDTRLLEFKQKIGTVCDLVEISIGSNVAEIECENAKPTEIEENVKKFVSICTTDLRVKAFNIKMEESLKVVNVLKTTCTDFSDKTVSVFIESTVCYLVSPAHVFENNMVALQKAHEFISALPYN